MSQYLVHIDSHNVVFFLESHCCFDTFFLVVREFTTVVMIYSDFLLMNRCAKSNLSSGYYVISISKRLCIRKLISNLKRVQRVLGYLESLFCLAV